MSSKVDSGQADVQLHDPESQPQNDVQNPAKEEAAITDPRYRPSSKGNSFSRSVEAWQTEMPLVEYL